ncbi:MAG: GNAT family N-acetyltransferase [Thermoplasmatota archaeon]|jgi:ribosomal protein S18 acetylase RimI-like enzyme
MITNQGDIRIAKNRDIERIVEIEKKCFKNNLGYSEKQLLYLIKKANSTCLVETKNNILRGFIIILYRKGTKVAGVETVDVDPAFQKQNIGLKLLKAAEKDMKKHGIKKARLEVSTKNTPAIRLYEKAGFKKVGAIKNYYIFDHDGSRDVFRMVKELI